MLDLAVTGYKAMYCETIYYQTLEHSGKWHLILHVCGHFWVLNFCWCLHQLEDYPILFMLHLVAQRRSTTVDFQLSKGSSRFFLVLTAHRWNCICNEWKKARQDGVFDVAYWRSIIMCCRENNTKHVEKLIPQSSSTRSAEGDCGTPWKAPEQLLMDIAERFVMLNFHWCKKYLGHLSNKSTYAQNVL